MIALANDPTAAAVLDTVPCYPVPPTGGSPAIDELRAAPAGRGIVVGHDGVMLIVRRPWLEADVPIAPSIAVHLPYGSIGATRGHLRCGLIPGDLREAVLDHLRAALPNEAAAFVIWNETTGTFSIDLPEIDRATPSRLVYRTPRLAAGCHLVCDIHSHGTAPAFFSDTDDVDDADTTKIAVVFGNLDAADGPTVAARLCTGGLFVLLPRDPFMGDHHAA